MRNEHALIVRMIRMIASEEVHNMADTAETLGVSLSTAKRALATMSELFGMNIKHHKRTNKRAGWYEITEWGAFNREYFIKN